MTLERPGAAQSASPRNTWTEAICIDEHARHGSRGDPGFAGQSWRHARVKVLVVAVALRRAAGAMTFAAPGLRRKSVCRRILRTGTIVERKFPSCLRHWRLQQRFSDARIIRTMISSLARNFGSLVQRVLHLRSLKTYEAACLDSWRDSLSTRGKEVLESQLRGDYFLQRQQAGAKVCFFFSDADASARFDNESPDLHVASVALSTDDGQHEMRAKIYTHRGRLFSIEFPKQPNRYFAKHRMRGSRLRVSKMETFASVEECAGPKSG